MAFPAVHLLVAMKALSHAFSGAYLLGAIAPDAVHMRPAVHSKSECKRQSHLFARGDGAEQVMEYWNQVGQSAFTLGYGVHVLTDRLWIQFYPEAFPALMDERRHTIASIYQQDAAQIDHRLVWEILRPMDFWTQLEHATPPEQHPYVSGNEIMGWRDKVIRELRAYSKKPPIPPSVMQYEQIDRFIDATGDALKAFLQQPGVG